MCWKHTDFVVGILLKKDVLIDSMICFHLHRKCLSLPFSFVVINMYCHSQTNYKLYQENDS